MNNYYLYRLEHSDQHVLIAWDDDLTFVDPNFDLQLRFDANPLISKLMQLDEFRVVYFAALQEAVDLSDRRENGLQIGALEAEIRRQQELIHDSMMEDTFRPWSDADVRTHTDLMNRFAPARVRFVGCEVARLTGGPAC